jgi:type II secretory pathway component HofQ
MPVPLLVFVLALAGIAPTAGSGAGDPETRVSLDVKESPVVEVVQALTRLAGFQAVFDPGIECRVTLKLDRVRWRAALDAALGACRLGREEEGDILRIAPLARIRSQAEDERRLSQARAERAPRSVKTFRLSYARAAKMAETLKRLLPGAEVVVDARTNTLIVID